MLRLGDLHLAAIATAAIAVEERVNANSIESFMILVAFARPG
jgi:hypothetical protein